MPAGNIATKDEFNRVTGELARSIERVMLAVVDTKAFLDANNAPGWATALGMTEADVATALTAVNKLDELAAIYRGEATKDPVEDFRVWMRPVRGLSSVI